jgi:hypothetical protein
MANQVKKWGGLCPKTASKILPLHQGLKDKNQIPWQNVYFSVIHF